MNGHGRTVLIVDDIAYVRKTLKQILSSHGFKIVGEAENGEQAIELFRETNPDLITMDLVMPLLNGVDTTRMILKQDPQAKIIILSAMMQENLVTEAILAGAKDYILKPFNSEEVIKTVNQVLNENASRIHLTHTGGAA